MDPRDKARKGKKRQEKSAPWKGRACMKLRLA
jgi:hypothetical protein